MNRRAHLLVGRRLFPLSDEPRCDEDHPRLERNTVACVECGRDLIESTYFAWVRFFRCPCGYLYGLRYRSSVLPS